MTFAKELRITRSGRGYVTAQTKAFIVTKYMDRTVYASLVEDVPGFEAELDRLEREAIVELRRKFTARVDKKCK